MPQCAAFGAQVRFVTDLGFGYLDDGVRTHRLEIDMLNQLLATCLTERAAEVLARYPTLFVPVDSPDAARESFRRARVG
ncbi:hypothetical protein [Jatrophihabitans sp.]|uniref:hypothetical protein n=1 Tax=Jatrophihabitans sp. TaxID=1932789 RepID=UPI002CBE7417|nr:hypothetical protein [Jatrophihabitans sp.]